MSYDTERLRLGRLPVMIAELHLDRCENVYGEAPCTASGPAAKKCFNTLATCQDAPNYVNGELVLRFSTVRIDDVDASGPFTFPTLVDVDTAPTELQPGKGLGIRASVSLTIQDHPWTDRGIDPYLNDRDYNPANRGRLWARLIQRQRYFEGRSLVLRTGYLTEDGRYDAANFVTRAYVISKVSGPDEKGNIRVEAGDPLRYADNERHQIPEPTNFALDAPLDDAATAFSATCDEALTEPGYLRIDDEVMKVLTWTETGTDPWTYDITVTRATLPLYYTGLMVAQAHDASAAIVCCVEYNDRLDKVARAMLLRTTIPGTFVPEAEWLAAGLAFFQAYNVRALLTKPTAVKVLLEELCDLNALMWWDDRAQQIKLDCLRLFPLDPPPLYTDENSLAGSTSVAQVQDTRISRVLIYFGQRNPVEDDDDAKNYQNVQVVADLDQEAPERYGTKVSREIYSRWLDPTRRDLALEIAGRLLSTYRDVQQQVAWSLDPKDESLWTGQMADIEMGGLVDQFGEKIPMRTLVLQVREDLTQAGFKYAYLGQRVGSIGIGRSGLISPDEIDGNPFPDFPDATNRQRARYAFICQDDGKMPNGEPGYIIG